MRALLCASARLCVCASLAAAQQRQTPPAGGTPHAFRLPAGRTINLPNGMGITMVQYGSVPKATISLVIHAGNANETPNETWLGDITTDLMREGTTSKSGAEISAAAASMGGGLGVTTGIDESNVNGDVLGEYAADMVRLVADVATHPAFPEAELARLKANRLRNLTVQLRSAGAPTLKNFRAAMYPNHPYGIIYPTPEMVNAYTVDQVRAWYTANWGAARAHLYVVGRFDERTVEAAAREAFGSWQRGADPVVNLPTPVARRAIVSADRPSAPQSNITLGLPVANPSSQDWIPLVVTNTLLGGYFSSRITSNIREDKGYTYSPFSQLSSRFHDTYWAESADVTTANTGASLHEIFYEIDRMRTAPVTADELSSAQNYLAGIFVLQNTSRFGIANQLAFVALQGLPNDYLTTYVSKVMAVTPADVQRMAQQYIDPSRILISVTGDLNVIRDQIAPYGSTTP